MYRLPTLRLTAPSGSPPLHASSWYDRTTRLFSSKCVMPPPIDVVILTEHHGMTLPHGQLSVRRGQQCAEGELVAFPPGLRPRLDDAGACDTVEMGRRCVVSKVRGGRAGR